MANYVHFSVGPVERLVHREIRWDIEPVGRWLWVFHDLHRVESALVNGRQGVWTLPTRLKRE